MLWLTMEDNLENKMFYKWKSPRKRVFTENVEANKKETVKKPLANVQDEEIVNDFFVASTNDD